MLEYATIVASAWFFTGLFVAVLNYVGFSLVKDDYSYLHAEKYLNKKREFVIDIMLGIVSAIRPSWENRYSSNKSNE